MTGPTNRLSTFAIPDYKLVCRRCGKAYVRGNGPWTRFIPFHPGFFFRCRFQDAAWVPVWLDVRSGATVPR